jgi:hypothetical protein
VGTPADPNGFRSIRDVGKELGYDFGNVADDHSALQQLILRATEAQRLQSQMQQMQELARHGQTYLQHAPAFQQWLQQQQAAAQQADQAKKNWFKAPEWDPAWASFITKDAQGNLVPVQGAPPGVVDKYLAFTNHQREFMQKFAMDPIAAIRPGLEAMMQEIASQQARQAVGATQGEQFAQNFIQQHSAWLHARDAQGNILSDWSGQPQFSPAGVRFQQLVTEAANLGIVNGEHRARYAYNLLRAEIAQAQATPAAQQAAAQANGDALKNQFLQNAAGAAPNASGSQTAPVNPNTPPATPNGRKTSQRDLQALLMEEMKKNGFQPGQPVPVGQR